MIVMEVNDLIPPLADWLGNSHTVKLAVAVRY